MFMPTYASSRVKRTSFYRKSELQMFLLISGGHIGAQNGAPIRRHHTNIPSVVTVGHKDLRLGQIVYILVFYNIHFLGFFHWTVSNLIFCCVTVKTIYWGRLICYSNAIYSFQCTLDCNGAPAPLVSRFVSVWYLVFLTETGRWLLSWNREQVFWLQGKYICKQNLLTINVSELFFN